MSRKPIIAVDLDDVLASTIEGTLAHVAKLVGIELAHGDITAEEYWAQYGIEDSKAIRLVHDYNAQGFPGLIPVDGAVEAIGRLKERYDLHVVTSRDESVKGATHEWLDKYFPGMFQGVVLAGNPYVSKTSRSKEDVCRELGAEWLVDDSISHTVKAADVGIKAILFGGHEWHVDVTPRMNLSIAKNWGEVEGLLEK